MEAFGHLGLILKVAVIDPALVRMSCMYLGGRAPLEGNMSLEDEYPDPAVLSEMNDHQPHTHAQAIAFVTEVLASDGVFRKNIPPPNDWNNKTELRGF